MRGSSELFLPQMPEEQAFCVLVKIMYDYQLRDLFKQGFQILHLKFYQLERLMQVDKSKILVSLKRVTSEVVLLCVCRRSRVSAWFEWKE